jgi:hypothetical protein
VTATDPAFGDQGAVNETVAITGSGFAPGAQAAWLLKGTVDTTITVVSTQYVSATKLIAVINISRNSPVDFRDVMVTNSSRTQGIGSLVFEVTQAVQIPGATSARSINDNGEATGTSNSGGVFYYNVATGVFETVAETGTGYDISSDGAAIVGSAGGGSGFPYLFRRVGPGAWQGIALPIDASTTSGIAQAMAVDGTGQVTLIGGTESYQATKNTSGTRAVVWRWQSITGTWQRSVLPPGGGTAVRHRALSASGIVGGTAAAGLRLGPAVWVPDVTGAYTLTTLASSGAVNGVRSDGGMLVGFTSAPVYWLAMPGGGGWSSPVTVGGGCNGVKDVSDAGRIILNDCPFTNGGQTFAAYSDAPYGSLTRLGGLGPKSNVGFVSGISHGGRYAAGNASVNTLGTVAIYWNLP